MDLGKNEVFQTISFEVGIKDDGIVLKEEKSNSEVRYEAFEQILKRKAYFVFFMKKTEKLYLPIKQLSQVSEQILSSKVTK